MHKLLVTIGYIHQYFIWHTAHTEKPKSYCSKQKITPCAISIIPNFLAGFMQKMSMTKIKAVQCELCELWIHIKCKNLNYLDYRYLQNCDES